jgi:hypothetical protein
MKEAIILLAFMTIITIASPLLGACIGVAMIDVIFRGGAR